MTKKAALVQKYVEVVGLLKEILPEKDLFPDVRDVPIPELVFFLTTHFTTEKNYALEVRSILNMKEIAVSDDKFEKIVSIVSPFITWLKQL